MSAPLTQTQIANNSILDINGRQTYLGNSFMLPIDGSVITTGDPLVEYPVFVISNPQGSGKSLFFFNKILSTDFYNAVIKFYLNPTLSATGSATPVVNLRSRSTTSSVTSCYLTPTVTSNGSLVEVDAVFYLTRQSGLLTIVDQGNSLLVTGQVVPNQGPVTPTAFVPSLEWYEI